MIDLFLRFVFILKTLLLVLFFQSSSCWGAWVVKLSSEAAIFTGKLNQFQESDSFGARPLKTVFETIHYEDGSTNSVQVSRTDLDMRYTYQENWSKRDKHILIVGGSSAFGWGTGDDKTLAFYLANRFTEHRTYTFAFYGAAPNDLHQEMKKTKILEKIPLQKGFLIIPFSRDYYVRVAGTVEHMRGRTSGHHSWYELENDKAIFKGNFYERWYSSFYKMIGRVIPKNSGIDLPQIGPYYKKLTVAILKEMANDYLAIFPNNKVYVLLFKDAFDDARSNTEIKMLLKNYGLDFIESSSLKHLGDKRYFSSGDIHLSPLVNEIVSKDVYQALMNETRVP